MDLLLENQSAASDVSVTKENWFEPIQISFELEAFDTANERLIPQLNWSGLAIMNSSYVPAPFDYLDSTNQSTEDDDQLQKNHSSPYLMPWPQQSAWIAIFTLMLIVATVGNALVAWIVLAHRRMKTVTNYFLVNLSLADLMMSLFNCIFNFIFMLNSHWPFGGTYCTVNNFIANVTVASSVFTLVAISSDRYIAIVHPLRPRMSKCLARMAIAVIWLASLVLAIPCLLYSQTISHRFPNGELRIVCLLIWPDGLPSVSQQDFIYNIIFTVLTYLMPVMVMAACYSRMSHVLWRSESIGELSQRQIQSIHSKRKVVRMFIVVVVLFAVCWLPYHGYFVYQFINRKVMSSKYVQHIFLAFYWMAMSNAMINPIVYYWMNARFRQYFKSVMCDWMYRSTRPITEGNRVPEIFPHFSQSGSNARSGREIIPFAHYIATPRGNKETGIGGGDIRCTLIGKGTVATNSPRTSYSHQGHHRCLVFNRTEPISNSDPSPHYT